MEKGVDFTGITVSYIVLDPKQWILCSLRSDKCRDEHLVRDMWWGWLKFGETITQAIQREIQEELGLDYNDYDTYRLWIREMFREKNGKQTHRIWIQHLIIPHHPEKIENKEPDKHLEIKFFPFNQLPPREQAHSQFYLILTEFKNKIEEITGIKIQI